MFTIGVSESQKTVLPERIHSAADEPMIWLLEAKIKNNYVVHIPLTSSACIPPWQMWKATVWKKFKD